MRRCEVHAIQWNRYSVGAEGRTIDRGKVQFSFKGKLDEFGFSRQYSMVRTLLPVVENFRRQAGAKRIKIEPASVYPIEKGYLLKLVVVKNAELVGWD